MSKLDDMINRLCPDGVEVVKLGEVCEIKRGVRVVKKELLEKGEIPVYQNSLTPLGYNHSANYPANTTFVISAGAAGEIGYSNIPFWAADDCLCISSPNNMNNKYIYYFLKSNGNKIKSRVRKASIPRLSRTVIDNIEIPLPPLEVQNEIVRILDHFTQLEAELEAELDCRKRQYEYYRDQLLNFDNVNVKMVKMGDFFTFKNGINKGKQFFGSGNYIVNFTDVYKNRWLKKEMLKGRVQAESKDLLAYDARKGDLFFTRTSETKEDIGMVSTLVDDVEDCVFSGFVLRARPLTNNWSPKFCSYYFSTTQMRQQIVRYASFTTRALTSGPRLSKLLLPQIPLSEQERIVAILDRFKSLTTSLQEGLPAEIAARRQQYEYYRDRLLDFKKKTA